MKLDQFLKLHGIVATGGEAKHVIQNGEVTVNGMIETRRGKKLTGGDQISVWGQCFVLEDDPSDADK